MQLQFYLKLFYYLNSFESKQLIKKNLNKFDLIFSFNQLSPRNNDL